MYLLEKYMINVNDVTGIMRESTSLSDGTVIVVVGRLVVIILDI
jgi:hypothetical protein